MKITISIASKAPIKPLKRAWVDLGQNLGGNRHTDEGKVGVKWGWKSTPKGLDESWIKLGWNRGKAGVKSGRISPDKRRTRSVQNASVWRRGRIGYFSDFSARKALKTRRIEPVQDRYKGFGMATGTRRYKSGGVPSERGYTTGDQKATIKFDFLRPWDQC